MLIYIYSQSLHGILLTTRHTISCAILEAGKVFGGYSGTVRCSGVCGPFRTSGLRIRSPGYRTNLAYAGLRRGVWLRVNFGEENGGLLWGS
jgi:hypothetical protein